MLKSLCWFVGLIIDPRNKQSWLLRSQKWLLTKSFDQQECWVKHYHVKCPNVRAFEKLTIRDLTNGLRANLFSNTVWFEDESGGSWWTCKTLDESRQNEKDSEVVQVWDCIVEDVLRKLIGTTYTNKMHIIFGSSLLKTLKLSMFVLK